MYNVVSARSNFNSIYNTGKVAQSQSYSKGYKKESIKIGLCQGSLLF